MHRIFTERYKSIMKQADYITYVLIALIVFQPLMFSTSHFINYSLIVSVVMFMLSVLFRRVIVFNSYIKGYLLFWGYCVFSILWSGNFHGSLRLRDCAICILVMIVVAQSCVGNYPSQMIILKCRLVMQWYVICVTIITVLCYFAEGENIRRWPRLGATLFTTLELTQITYSCFLIVAVYFLFYLIITSKKHKYSHILVYVFLLISAALTGIRKIIILPFVQIITYILVKYRQRLSKLIIALVISLVLGGLALLGVMKYSISTAKRIMWLYYSLTSGTVQDVSFSERSVLLELAYKCFREHPVVGIGIGQFKFYSASHGGPNAYAHNNYLELLASLGIIGTYLYYNAIIKQLKFTVNNTEAYFIISYIISMLASDVFQVSYFYLPFVIGYVIICCMANTIQYEKPV